MNPAGKLASVLTFPSTFIRRCITILVTSELFNAYFKRLRKKITNGKDSRSLCGPCDGRGAKTPPSLSNIHAFGACRRFKCFLGPRACNKKPDYFFNILVLVTEYNTASTICKCLPNVKYLCTCTKTIFKYDLFKKVSKYMTKY